MIPWIVALGANAQMPLRGVNYGSEGRWQLRRGRAEIVEFEAYQNSVYTEIMGAMAIVMSRVRKLAEPPDAEGLIDVVALRVIGVGLLRDIEGVRKVQVKSQKHASLS